MAQPSITLGTAGEKNFTTGATAIGSAVACSQEVCIPLNNAHNGALGGINSSSYTFNVSYAGGATFVGWQVKGDISIVSSTSTSITIQSTNKSVRTGAGVKDYSQSKGRVQLTYNTGGGCGQTCYFDVFKTYDATNVSPIVGPTCLDKLQQYTFSVDALASDNLFEQIGMDRYFWSVPAGVTIDYYSNDSSSITFTTTAGYTGGTVQCCYGLCNQYSQFGVLSGSPRCVSQSVNLIPQPITVTFTGASTAAVSTFPANICASTNTSGSTTLGASVVGSNTYKWTWTPATWNSPAQPFTGNSLSIAADNNPGAITLTTTTTAGCTRQDVINVNRTYASNMFSVPQCNQVGTPFNATIAGGSASAGGLSGIPQLNTPFTGLSAPAGFTASYNNLGTIAMNPGASAVGNYTVTIGGSNNPTACPVGTYPNNTYSVSLKPATPSILPAAAACGTSTLSTTPVTGVNYTWSITGGTGYTCTGCGANTANTSITVTAGTAGICTVTLTETVIGSSPACVTAATTKTVSLAPTAVTNPVMNCTVMTQPSTVPVTVTGGGGATTYTWSIAPTTYGTLSAVSTAVPTVNFNYNGTVIPASTNVTITCYASNGTCNTATASSTINIGAGGAGNGGTAPFSLTGPFYLAANPPDPAMAELDVTGSGGTNGGTGTTQYTWYNCTAGVSGFGAGSILPNTVYRTNPTVGNSSWLFATSAPGVTTNYGAQMSKNGCVTRYCAAVTNYQNMVAPHGGGQGNVYSILDKASIPSIGILPNPNNGVFKVELNNASEKGWMYVMDVAGTRVAERTVMPGINEFNLENLPAGIYNLRFIVNSYERVEKIVITK